MSFIKGFVVGVLVGIGYVSYRFTGQTLNLSKRAQIIYNEMEKRDGIPRS